MIKRCVVLCALLLQASVVMAELVEKRVEYRDGDQRLIGRVYFDSAMKGKRPGVIVFSDWLGMSPFSMDQARRLVQLGYVAFIADIYGDGLLAKSPDEAGALATKIKADRPLMRRRAQAGYAAFMANAPVDEKKIGAIGFCFGGTVGLELARTGAALAGVVSFHGGLDTPNPEDAKRIKGKILVLHGADDSFVPDEEVMNFEKEMTSAGVVWELVKYSQAVHAFTNPEAGSDNSKGVAYNPLAAARAFEAMKDFLREVL